MDAPIIENVWAQRDCTISIHSPRSQAGARLAFESDWPIVDCNPFSGIRAAVTGRDIDGNLSTTREHRCRNRASGVHGRGPACLGMEGGTLEKGPRRSDLLDREPRTVDWMQPGSRILATIVDGRLIHEQSD